MPEIQTTADAKERLKDNFPSLKNKHGIYLDDYARIAWFLSDAQLFETALTRVSADIWDEYRVIDQKQRNRFSIALGAVARRAGFLYQPHLQMMREVPILGGNTQMVPVGPLGVVLVAATSYELFADYVKRGIFWKDDMDLNHGEHSHTLQWLAIHKEGHLANGVPDLYARTIEIQTSDKSPKPLYLWNWLVDCFPSTLKKLGEEFADGKNVSDTYRSPQCVTQHLLNYEGNDRFLSAYLRLRYNRRNWVKTTKDGTLAFSGDLKNYASQKRDKKTESWQPVTEMGKGNRPEVVAYERIAPNLGLRKNDPASGEDALFHGQPGVLTSYFM